MRKLTIIFAFFVCAAELRPNFLRGQGWHGIVPLVSKRAEVERVLGSAENKGDVSTYQTKEGFVSVHYATSPCNGAVLGWNVPRDTVLEIQLSPPIGKQITIDEKKFVRAHGHGMSLRFINLNEGLRYDLLPNGAIDTISFIPSTSNSHLRCPGFPAYDGGLTQYRPFDVFSDSPAIDKEARLDNFAASLGSDPNVKGYIIVYAGERSQPNEAKTEAQRLVEHLVETRKVDRRRIIGLDGGFRQEREINLYVIPAHLPPPAPTPTLPSRKIQSPGVTKRKQDTRCPHRMRRTLPTQTTCDGIVTGNKKEAPLLHDVPYSSYRTSEKPL